MLPTLVLLCLSLIYHPTMYILCFQSSFPSHSFRTWKLFPHRLVFYGGNVLRNPYHICVSVRPTVEPSLLAGFGLSLAPGVGCLITTCGMNRKLIQNYN